MFVVFWVLHPMRNQAYNIELSGKWKIYDVFHVLLLEENITRKRGVETAIKLDKGNSKKYKVEIIHDGKIYAKELDNGHLLDLHYLVF